MATLNLIRNATSSLVPRQFSRFFAEQVPKNIVERKRISFRSAAFGGSLLCIYTFHTTSHCDRGLNNADGSSSDTSRGRSSFSSWKGCGGGGGGGKDSQDDPMEKIIALATGQLQNIGFGGLMGICSGVAFKRVGTAVATLIGISFAGLQVLAYYGYIQVDFNKMKKDAENVVDLNKDGKIDHKDVIAGWNKIKDMLTLNLPGMGGFSSGFAMALYFA